ncbi:MAG: hypothetical protein ABW162_17225 [Candidatus Sedimenticola sp. PURPLELP]
MRWLFLLLLLINGGIFIWGYSSEGEQAVQTPVVSSPGVGNIRLLSELSSEDEVQPEADDPVQGRLPEVVKREPVPVEQETPEITATVDGVAEETQAAVDGGEQVATEDEPVETLPAAPEPVLSQPYCGVLGPLEKSEAAKAIAAQLNQLGFETSSREQSLVRTTGYWVLIPAAKDQQGAIKNLKALQDKGFKDVRRFLQGPLKNAISLGAFSRRVNAQSRRAEVEASGFKVEVRPRISDSIVYWIDLRLATGGAERAADILRSNYPGLEIRKQSCPRIVRP